MPAISRYVWTTVLSADIIKAVTKLLPVVINISWKVTCVVADLVTRFKVASDASFVPSYVTPWVWNTQSFDAAPEAVKVEPQSPRHSAVTVPPWSLPLKASHANCAVA